MATFWSRARPLAAAAGVAASGGLLAMRRPVLGDDAPPKKVDFVALKCLRNEEHTHDTRKITLGGIDSLGPGPVVNVQVRAPVGAGSNGCCACCKCGASCGCPKKPSGCCACCKCEEPCTCPKRSGANVVRMYNPIALSGDGTLTLLVKKYADSKMGTHLHSLKPGDSVEVKGPNRQWKFEPGKYKEYAMIAGGTGITPLIQAAGHILKADSAKVTIVCANKSMEDRLLMEELEVLAKAHPGRLRVETVVDSKPPGHVPQSVSVGRVDCKDLLAKLLPPPTADVLVMVCGRGDMVKAVAGPKTKDFKQGEVDGVLRDLGYSSSQVWKM